MAVQTPIFGASSYLIFSLYTELETSQFLSGVFHESFMSVVFPSEL